MQRLADAGLNFVVIGGVCAAYYGYTVNTYDLDICFDFSETNVRKLHAAVINALITAKKATARPNDMRTVGQLEAIREAMNKNEQNQRK